MGGEGQEMDDSMAWAGITVHAECQTVLGWNSDKNTTNNRSQP